MHSKESNEVKLPGDSPTQFIESFILQDVKCKNKLSYFRDVMFH